jgi:hypothetical protein
MIYAPINTILPSSTGSAAVIELPDIMAANDYAIQARGSVDMQISNVQAMTTYYTIKSGTAISLSQVVSKGAQLFWAKSGGAADTVEVLPLVK